MQERHARLFKSFLKKAITCTVMVALIIIVTFIATVAGAISGIGGVIIKPVMDALCGYSVSTISFLSGTTILAMTAVSLARSLGDSIRIDAKAGTSLAAGGAVGGIAGKLLFGLVKEMSGNDAMVGMIQNIVLLGLTSAVFLYVMRKSRINTHHVTSSWFAALIGAALGVFSSFLGIGGGPINIMVLSFFFSMDSKHAALNSLYIIFFSQTANLLGNIISGSIPEFSWGLLGGMMACGVTGAIVGRRLSRNMSNESVDRLFSWIMLVIMLISIVNAVRFAISQKHKAGLFQAQSALGERSGQRLRLFCRSGLHVKFQHGLRHSFAIGVCFQYLGADSNRLLRLFLNQEELQPGLGEFKRLGMEILGLQPRFVRLFPLSEIGKAQHPVI